MKSCRRALNGSFASVISFQGEVLWCQVDVMSFLGTATGSDMASAWRDAATGVLVSCASDELRVSDWTESVAMV